MLTIVGAKCRDKNTIDPYKATAVATAIPPSVGGGSSSLIDAATTPGQQPTGRTGYTLVFSDEFNGTTLNRAKWDPWYPDTPYWNDNTVPGGHLTNTGEPEAYDPSGITFSGGSMVFTMRNQVTVTGLPFTSGMVTSYPSFNPLYGFFEARMMCNLTDGMWPAFWMDRTDQSWPPEIDIMENYGGGSFYQVSQTYHPAVAAATANTFVMWPENVGPELWHTYAAEWRAGQVKWYVDGVLTFTYTNADVSNAAMYLICNLAGTAWSWPTAGSLPQSIWIDYIRAWA